LRFIACDFERRSKAGEERDWRVEVEQTAAEFDRVVQRLSA
jgi:hypothetical protein